MILVAGGDGFIGSNLLNLLREKHGVSYVSYDLKSHVDVCDIDGSDYDAIVLLAANLGHDMQMFNDNLRIYQWAIKQPAHIIYTSSAAVYGDAVTPHTEDEPTPAPTLYGISKLLGEQLIKQACSNYTILRLANVYSNGDGNGAIDIFKRGGNKIYGNGDDIRDYVNVKVVTEAIRKIALDPASYNQEILNISSNMPMTTRAAYTSFGNWRKPPEFLPARGFDVKCSILNNAKAKKAGLIT